MSGRWWECKTCAKYLGIYGEGCLDHREETGHIGAQLMRGEPPANVRPLVVRKAWQNPR